MPGLPSSSLTLIAALHVHVKHADALLRRVIGCLCSLVPTIIRTRPLLYSSPLFRNVFCLCYPDPNLNWPYSWLFPTFSHGLSSLDRLFTFKVTCYVLSDICSSSHEPHVQLVLEITGKMTRCLAQPTLVQICNRDVLLVQQYTCLTNQTCTKSLNAQTVSKRLQKTYRQNALSRQKLLGLSTAAPTPQPPTTRTHYMYFPANTMLQNCQVWYGSVLLHYVVPKVPWFLVRKNLLR